MTKLFGEMQSEYIRSLLDDAANEIKNEREEIITRTPEDQYINNLRARYSRKIPEVNFAGFARVGEPVKRKIQVPRPPSGYFSDYEKEIEVNDLKFEYPVSGNVDLLRYSNILPINTIEAELRPRSIIVEYTYRAEDSTDFANWRAGTEKLITDRLSEASREYSNFEVELGRTLTEALKRRKAEIESKNQFLSKINVPAR